MSTHDWRPALGGWEECVGCHQVLSPGSPAEARGGTCTREPAFTELVEAEFRRATTEHGLDYHSDHEAFAVLLEEVEEVKAWVWRKRNERDRRAMIHELVQVAAIARKWAEQLERRSKPRAEPEEETKTVHVVEIEQIGEWSSVSTVHRSEDGARAAAAKLPLARDQKVHVNEFSVEP